MVIVFVVYGINLYIFVINIELKQIAVLFLRYIILKLLYFF